MAPSDGICKGRFKVRQMPLWLGIPGKKDDWTLPSRDQLGDKAKAGPTDSPVLLGVAFGRTMASKLP